MVWKFLLVDIEFECASETPLFWDFVFISLVSGRFEHHLQLPLIFISFELDSRSIPFIFVFLSVLLCCIHEYV